MIFRLSSISRILAVLLLFVAVIPAQRGEGELSSEQIEAMQSQRSADGKGRSEKESATDRKNRWEAMTPEERLDSNIRRGSKAHCRFVATCRPPKMLPGQSGVMMITAILSGQSVLPAPLQMQLTPRVQPGAVAIGSLSPRPALPGTIAKAYLGRPVYENTAVFEVPVTMGNDAKLGSKALIAVDLQFDIYHGDTGQTIGRFIERVTTDVEVAPYVDPPVSNRTPKVQPKPAPIAPIEVTNPDANPSNVIEPDSNAMSGTVTEVPVDAPEPVEVDAPATPSKLPPTDSGEGLGLPSILAIGGGAFLLVMVLLLKRKK
ncbi:MAG: hypothetical protein ACI85K_001987 [Hyphomicrobiaceae bacterium]|jgi:hypothetical protein